MNLSDRYLDFIICINSYQGCLDNEWLTITIDVCDMYIRVISTNLIQFVNTISSLDVMGVFV